MIAGYCECMDDHTTSPFEKARLAVARAREAGAQVGTDADARRAAAEASDAALERARAQVDALTEPAPARRCRCVECACGRART